VRGGQDVAAVDQGPAAGKMAVLPNGDHEGELVRGGRPALHYPQIIIQSIGIQPFDLNLDLSMKAAGKGGGEEYAEEQQGSQHADSGTNWHLPTDLLILEQKPHLTPANMAPTAQS
jgi:hypothetical protein